MQHKFGEVVTYQMGKVSVNALVVQSNPQPDGEHLTLVYVDPAVASSSMSGMLVDKAIARAFAPPLGNGRSYGWKELEGLGHIPVSVPKPTTGVPDFETKHYADGSSATGVAPLPDKSPDEQKAAVLPDPTGSTGPENPTSGEPKPTTAPASSSPQPPSSTSDDSQSSVKSSAEPSKSLLEKVKDELRAAEESLGNAIGEAKSDQ